MAIRNNKAYAPDEKAIYIYKDSYNLHLVVIGRIGDNCFSSYVKDEGFDPKFWDSLKRTCIQSLRNSLRASLVGIRNEDMFNLTHERLIQLGLQNERLQGLPNEFNETEIVDDVIIKELING